MSRFINLAFFVLLSISIYTTFSIKEDVATLAKKVALLKKNIYTEEVKVDIYKAEFAVLTGAAHIDKLKNKLIPNLKVVSVSQIKSNSDILAPSQLAYFNKNQ